MHFMASLETKSMGKSATEKRRERRKRQKETSLLEMSLNPNGSKSRSGGDLFADSPYYSVDRVTENHWLREKLTEGQWTNLMAAMSSSSLSTDKPRSNGPRSAIYDNGSTYDQLKAMVDDLFWDLHKRQDVWDPKTRAVLTHPGYSDTESKQAAKFGPYMNAYTTEVAGKLIDYFGPEFAPTNATAMEIADAILEVAQDLQNANDGRPLEPVSVDDAYQLMPKDKFYGYPHFTSKWSDSDDIVNETISLARKISELDRDAVQIYHESPWVVFNRVVPNGYEAPKVRATMAPSKYGALFEKMFTHPVLCALKSTEWGVGYQGNHVVGPIIQGWVRDYSTCFSMDYEAFDQHTRKYARNCVRDVLKLAFDESFSPVIEMMFEAFDNPGVIMSKFLLLATQGFGLGSGIGPTGIIGTIWNRIIAVCIRKRMNLQFGIEDVRHLGYGDDTLFCFDYAGHIPTEWFYNQVKDFGMVINPSKQEYSSGKYRYASFLALQYYWLDELQECSEGVYSIYRAWARILFKDVQLDQEDKWVRAEYEGLSPVGCDMLDTISTLENCKGNPAFPAFVDLVREGHPLRLKSSHFLPASKLATYTGEENKGLKSFHSVRHIINREVLEGEAGVVHDIEWQRYCLRKFSSHIWRSKGILITASQAVDYLNGSNIHWDLEQLSEAAARGTDARKPLADRVRDLELRKGVILSLAQIEDLRCNRKITWSDRDRAILQRFGQLTDSEKDLWRATHLENTLVREVVNNRRKYDFEALWHEVGPKLLKEDKDSERT